MAIGTLAGLLDSCGFQHAGLQYHRSAFSLLKLSAAITTENESMDELFNAVNILTSAGIDPATEPWASYIDLAIKDDDPTARADRLPA